MQCSHSLMMTNNSYSIHSTSLIIGYRLIIIILPNNALMIQLCTWYHLVIFCTSVATWNWLWRQVVKSLTIFFENAVQNTALRIRHILYSVFSNLITHASIICVRETPFWSFRNTFAYTCTTVRDNNFGTDTN